jgi:hypothetical protein
MQQNCDMTGKQKINIMAYHPQMDGTMLYEGMWFIGVMIFMPPPRAGSWRCPTYGTNRVLKVLSNCLRVRLPDVAHSGEQGQS